MVGNETCDDGFDDQKGCNGTKNEILPGWDCKGGSNTSSTICTSICGDGMRVGDETCDDGNIDEIGCKETCRGARKGWKCDNPSDPS